MAYNDHFFENKRSINTETPLPKSMKIDTIRSKKKHSIDRIMKFDSHGCKLYRKDRKLQSTC